MAEISWKHYIRHIKTKTLVLRHNKIETRKYQRSQWHKVKGDKK